jgi:hypothetical protein
MAFYLVSAIPRADRLAALQERLAADAFVSLRPFGATLSDSLQNARRRPDDGTAVWEEEDYCWPPLAQERAAVLDQYFDQLKVEAVQHGEGWTRIAGLPPLFPTLVGR